MKNKTIAALILVESDLGWLLMCLPKLGFIDEIVICDNGPDKTIKQKILDSFPDFNIKYYFDPELNPVTKMLKYASVIESDFIYWLHPDEIVSDELGQEISTSLKKDEGIDAYAICPINIMFGTNFGRSTSYSVRIMRKEIFQFRNTGSVHAEILLDGHEEISIYNGLKIKKLKGEYIHYPNPYFLLYLVKIFRYEMINVKETPNRELNPRIIGEKPISFYELLKLAFLISRRFVLVYRANRKYGFGGFCLAAGSVLRIIAEKIAPTEELQFRQGKIDFNDTRGYINLVRERHDITINKYQYTERENGHSL